MLTTDIVSGEAKLLFYKYVNNEKAQNMERHQHLLTNVDDRDRS